MLAEDGTYVSKFSEPGVQDVVESNRRISEPDANIIDESLQQLRENEGNRMESYNVINDQENTDVHEKTGDDPSPDECFYQQSPSHFDQTQSENTGNAITFHNQPTQISDDNLRHGLRSLNPEQRCAYDIFLSWCRSKMKNLNTLKPVEFEPIYLFITSGGGAGKSHLIRTIYHTAVKTFRHPPINPES